MRSFVVHAQAAAVLVWLLACSGESDPDASRDRATSTSSQAGGGRDSGAGGSSSAGGGEPPTDACATDDGGCDDDAECVSNEGVPVCTCRPGFEGDGITCEDVDECASGDDDCSEDAWCDNTIGGFACACADGFEGDGIDCDDVDECDAGDDDCSPDARCENTPGSFTCTCDAGFEGDGLACDDIDECTRGDADCSENATCENDAGGYTCSCDEGFEGDGRDCDDVDECEDDNGGCDPNATCTNEVGSRSCACDDGFTGNGLACDDVDECEDGGGCSADATCNNLPGTWSCTCNDGYEGDGISCEDVDECETEPSPCDPVAACTNTVGGFSCECLPPFTGDGLSCTCGASPLLADAGDDVTAVVGEVFVLDGRASAGEGLTFSWAPVADAPALTGADTAQPTATAASCTSHSYVLTVVDACGRTDSDSVVVTAPANGRHVSRDTCITAEQCGSIDKPWCSIASGVQNSAVSPVRVASSGFPYSGVAMRDGVDVEGGYEPTFTTARDPDPATNGTFVATEGTAFSWAAEIRATLDGFRIRAERTSGSAPATASVIVVSGEADIANVTVETPGASVYASDAAALRLQGSGSALVRGLSVLRAPRGSTRSAGADVSVSATLDLEGDAMLQGGPASESFGIRHTSLAELVLTGGVVAAGAGTTRSIGISAGGQNYPGTSITGVTVRGGTAPDATGIRHGNAAQLTIEDATVLGEGSDADDTTTCGICVDETTTIAITRSEVRGTTSVAAGGRPTSSIGVRLGETSQLDAVATIVGSDIEGGSIGRERIGIRAVGVPLVVSEGTAAGSYGTNADVTVAIGVDLQPGFQIGDVVTIENNVAVLGGAANSSGGAAVGIRLRGGYVSLRVVGNELIQGSIDATTRAPTSGILLAPNVAGGAHLIAGNGVILGGPGIWWGHSGITAFGVNGAPLLAMTVEDNGLIAGNLDPTSQPDGAYGMRLRRVDAAILDNERIFGGYNDEPGDDGVAGIYAGSGLEGCQLEIAGNTIHGGDGWMTRGLRAEGCQLSVHENVIEACGLDGPPGERPPGCNGAGFGIQLARDQGSDLRNNYVFGGAIACAMQMDLLGYFEHNLCFAPSSPFGWAHALEASGAVSVRNNILDGNSDVSTAPYDRSAINFLAVPPGFEIAHNQLVLGPPSDPACAGSTNGGNCYASAAAVNALDGPGGLIYGNVDVPMGYVSADVLHPTVAGYHLDDACVLAGLALPSTLAEDFDGDPRSMLTIGPDECN